MQQTISLRLLPTEAVEHESIRKKAADTIACPIDSVTGFIIKKQSIDARSKQVWVNISLLVYINEPFQERVLLRVQFPDVSSAEKKVVVIGAGPAGLFAAIKLIEHGIQPIVLERGKDVRARRRDLAVLNKEGTVNPESNYCFGEGGAGTYSDGKLYTRSNKRGDINRILNLFVQFGADEKILYEAHPHIGTNKLPQIITAIREQIIQAGGVFFFEKKVTDLVITGDKLSAVKTIDGSTFQADAFILATGHSARDIFTLLHNKKIHIELKPFALGVRVEHPQDLIDHIQYHHVQRPPVLPAAAYSIVEQVNGRGVFSFCMCPGGIIAPAATDEGELVVNGWSPSKRNNPFANSGIVVPVEQPDLHAYKEDGPLAAMHFQQAVERKAYEYGGGKLVAPAQRMVDLVEKKVSATLPTCSYLPGLRAVSLQEVLPPFIFKTLSEGFKSFGKKMKGYYSNEAVVVATESRTSSPVRIPRDPETFQHPQLKNFYPCSEGAGYAGGIVSAAMDGENVAFKIAEKIKSNHNAFS